MTPDVDKRLIQNIQLIGQNYALERIVLFGSRARGDHKPVSDIDLAVFPLPEFNNRGRLSSELDDLETLLKIDIVFIDSQTDLRLLESIGREGVALYERPNSKIQNFYSALSRLKEGLAKYDENDDLAGDGVIQRFEFTFELGWKNLKAVFEAEGLTGLNSPKTVLREAYEAELIQDEELWLAMLADRNTTAHIYNQQLAKQICHNIQDKYVLALEELLLEIKTRLRE